MRRNQRGAARSSKGLHGAGEQTLEVVQRCRHEVEMGSALAPSGKKSRTSQAPEMRVEGFARSP